MTEQPRMSYGQLLYHLGLALDALEKVHVEWWRDEDAVLHMVQEMSGGRVRPRDFSSERLHRLRVLLMELEELVDEFMGEPEEPPAIDA